MDRLPPLALHPAMLPADPTTILRVRVLKSGGLFCFEAAAIEPSSSLPWPGFEPSGPLAKLPSSLRSISHFTAPKKRSVEPGLLQLDQDLHLAGNVIAETKVGLRTADAKVARL
jgi:hypothetical protein